MIRTKNSKENLNGSSSIWQKIVKENTISDCEPIPIERNVIFFGSENNGKEKLIRFLQGERLSRELEDVGDMRRNQSAFGLNYTYMRQEGENLNIFQIECVEFIDMLDLIFKDVDSLRNSVFVVTLDVTKIASIEDDLSLWLGKLSEFLNDKLFKRMGHEEIEMLKNKNSEIFRNTKPPKELEINLGVPIIVSLLNSESVWKVAEAHHQQKYAFDFMNPGDISHYFLNFLQYRLRKICVTFGASLLYISTESEFSNCRLLQDLIISALFGTPYDSVVERKRVEAIYIPWGYDSELQIVDDLGECVRHITKTPDTTLFRTVVKAHNPSVGGRSSQSGSPSTLSSLSSHQSNQASNKASSCTTFQRFLKKQRTMLKFEKNTKGGVAHQISGLHHHRMKKITIPTTSSDLKMNKKKKTMEFGFSSPQGSGTDIANIKKRAKMVRMASRGHDLIINKEKLIQKRKRSVVGGTSLREGNGSNNGGGSGTGPYISSEKRMGLKNDFKNFAASLSQKKTKKMKKSTMMMQSMMMMDHMKMKKMKSGSRVSSGGSGGSGLSSSYGLGNKFGSSGSSNLVGEGEKGAPGRGEMEDFFQQMLRKLSNE